MPSARSFLSHFFASGAEQRAPDPQPPPPGRRRYGHLSHLQPQPIGVPTVPPRAASSGAAIPSLPRPVDLTLLLAYLAPDLRQRCLPVMQAAAERRKLSQARVDAPPAAGAWQTIKDDTDDFVPAGEMLRRLMEGHAHYVEKLRAAHMVCERCRDVATASLLENLLDETERRKWFLFESVQGINNTD